VTNPDWVNRFVIAQDGSYRSCEVLTYSGENFVEVLQKIQEPAHVLVISPDHFFSSVEPHLIGRRQLAIMAANSTLTPPAAIKHFVAVLEVTDSQAQRRMADKFFATLEQEEALQIVDEFYGTIARFVHLNDTYEWFEQGGPLEWEQQQIVPSGELSVLPVAHGQFDSTRKLAINGEVAFQGFAILHSGKPSFLREDQERIYKALSTLEKHAVIATVEDGWITKLQTTHPSVERAKSMLQALFDVDSRYRLIWEVGFGINTQLKLWSGNTAMNEVYGADNGVIHWGLGLTPFTQYHLDLICPNTKVLGDTGEILIGLRSGEQPSRKQGEIARHTANACPCISY
jgi:hypothetical protein